MLTCSGQVDCAGPRVQGPTQQVTPFAILSFNGGDWTRPSKAKRFLPVYQLRFIDNNCRQAGRGLCASWEGTLRSIGNARHQQATRVFAR